MNSFYIAIEYSSNDYDIRKVTPTKIGLEIDSIKKTSTLEDSEELIQASLKLAVIAFLIGYDTQVRIFVSDTTAIANIKKLVVIMGLIDADYYIP